MKVILFVIFCAACTLPGFSQQASIPVKDFTLKSSTASVEVRAGETVAVDLTFQKSKQFQKGMVHMGIASTLPKGVSVTYQPETGVLDSVTATFNTTAEAIPGTYSIIMNGTINQKSKGVILKLIIL